MADALPQVIERLKQEEDRLNTVVAEYGRCYASGTIESATFSCELRGKAEGIKHARELLSAALAVPQESQQGPDHICIHKSEPGPCSWCDLRDAGGIFPELAVPQESPQPAVDIHDLKTWPVYFEAILSGAKTFELRKADRDFKVGDVLRLFEWDSAIREYTGREIDARVTYILRDALFGLEDGYVIMGIQRVAALAVPQESPQPLTTLIENVREVMASHRDKESADYNQCESAPCTWCETSAAAMAALAAGPSQPPTLQWTIDNVYTIARREMRRADNGKPLRPEMWAHVQRLCEEVGCQARTVGVLRETESGVESNAIRNVKAVLPMTEIPRRCRMEHWTPAERAIYDACLAVEAMPADERLTRAVTLLGEARDCVAAFVDAEPVAALAAVPQESPQRPETGPMQFGDDWPGVFIRGDRALAWAYMLRTLPLEADALPLTLGQLRGLIDTLTACDAKQKQLPKVQVAALAAGPSQPEPKYAIRSVVQVARDQLGILFKLGAPVDVIEKADQLLSEVEGAGPIPPRDAPCPQCQRLGAAGPCEAHWTPSQPEKETT